MTKPISRLILAAVLLSSLPLAASADGWRDGDRPGGWSGAASPGYPAPPPAASPAYPDRPRDPREWREHEWREHEWRANGWRDDGGREHRWREHELAEVSAQLRALDAQRDRFYAENGWNPWRARRFERWYQVRRAELERRWNELQPVAWR